MRASPLSFWRNWNSVPTLLEALFNPVQTTVFLWIQQFSSRANDCCTPTTAVFISCKRLLYPYNSSFHPMQTTIVPLQQRFSSRANDSLSGTRRLLVVTFQKSSPYSNIKSGGILTWGCLHFLFVALHVFRWPYFIPLEEFPAQFAEWRWAYCSPIGWACHVFPCL